MKQNPVCLLQTGFLFEFKAKKNPNFHEDFFVGRAGFEPAKFTQQIYSLPSLAA